MDGEMARKELITKDKIAETARVLCRPDALTETEAETVFFLPLHNLCRQVLSVDRIIK